MEFNDKNLEIVKIMAKIEQLETENKNLIKLLKSQSAKIEYQKQSPDNKMLQRESLTTPKRKINSNPPLNEKKLTEDYDLFNEDEDNMWNEYEDDNPELDQYEHNKST